MSEVGEACNVIQQAADEEANIIFGLVKDAELRDQVKISVIATGFDAPAALASRREVSLPVTPQGTRGEKKGSKSVPEPLIPPPEDSGFGVNLLTQRDPREDIFDIPTFLRRQMD